MQSVIIERKTSVTGAGVWPNVIVTILITFTNTISTFIYICISLDVVLYIVIANQVQPHYYTYDSNYE